MMTLHAVYTGLPQAFFDIIPELKKLNPPLEKQADCQNCPMTCKEEELPQKRYHFLPDVRCCTYHPLLFNWQIGQILSQGGVESTRVLRRLQNPDGRKAFCILEPSDLMELREKEKLLLGRVFGRDRRFRCPYWVEGELGCGIWKNRNAICRTWHCKHTNGKKSADFWYYLRGLLRQLEKGLAQWCMEQGEPPLDDAPLAELEEWYIHCFELVSNETWDTSSSVRDDSMNELLAFLQNIRESLYEPIPDLLGALVDEFEVHGERVLMQGYSVYDRIFLPVSIFAFLSKLDGLRTWQEALAESNASLEKDKQISADIVKQMYQKGLLEKVDGPEDFALGMRASITDGKKQRRFTPKSLYMFSGLEDDLLGEGS